MSSKLTFALLSEVKALMININANTGKSLLKNGYELPIRSEIYKHNFQEIVLIPGYELPLQLLN